ncbi:MAG: acyltransferase [Chloroflexota bacterium]
MTNATTARLPPAGLTPGTAASGGRIYQLDAIRGVLAIGVMLHHALGAKVPFGLGTWGVYAFFVLSGYAMEYVYGSRLRAGRFTVARIARLAPLWIPVVLLSSTQFDHFTRVRLLLNLTGLFGFVNPGATSLVRGGWSLGVEVACYALFLVVAWRRLPTLVLAILAVVALVYRTWYLGWAWNGDLAGDWSNYTQAPAFFVFFLGGMVASRYRPSSEMRARLGHWPFLAGCALVAGTLATGPAQLASPVVALVAIAGIWIAGLGVAWTGLGARVAGWLGDLSYGTYLLHPLFLIWAPKVWIVTPIAALAVHRFYEVPAGRAARSVLAWRPRARQHPATLASREVGQPETAPAGDDTHGGASHRP